MNKEQFDTIIIGSGVSGLTAALSLAIAGQKVLVLEQHYLPGGACHTFKIHGHEFCPGWHHVGDIHKGGVLNDIYRDMGLGEYVSFCEQNSDCIIQMKSPNFEFDIPKGKERIIAKLKKQFPEENKGIDKIFSIFECFYNDINKEETASENILDLLKVPFIAPSLAFNTFTNVEQLVNRYIKNPLLKWYILGMWQTFMTIPSKTSATLYGTVFYHYFNGSYYPTGGVKHLINGYIDSIKKLGGKIELNKKVDRILIKKERFKKTACGVCLENGTQLYAKNIVSSADPEMTYKNLVGEQYLSSSLKKKIKNTTYTLSCISLYLILKDDPNKFGLTPGADTCYYEFENTEKTMEHISSKECFNEDSTSFLFIAPEKNCNNIQNNKEFKLNVIDFVPYKQFEKYKNSKKGNRPQEYLELKEKIAKQIIEKLNTIFPGIKGNILYQETGTPLTMEHFLNKTKGACYGVDKTNLQLGLFRYKFKSEINNLFLCGEGTLSHGICGATMSGRFVASKVLGLKKSTNLPKAENTPEIVIHPWKSKKKDVL